MPLRRLSLGIAVVGWTEIKAKGDNSTVIHSPTTDAACSIPDIVIHLPEMRQSHWVSTARVTED